MGRRPVEVKLIFILTLPSEIQVYGTEVYLLHQLHIFIHPESQFSDTVIFFFICIISADTQQTLQKILGIISVIVPATGYLVRFIGFILLLFPVDSHFEFKFQ